MKHADIGHELDMYASSSDVFGFLISLFQILLEAIESDRPVRRPFFTQPYTNPTMHLTKRHWIYYRLHYNGWGDIIAR